VDSATALSVGAIAVSPAVVGASCLWGGAGCSWALRDRTAGDPAPTQPTRAVDAPARELHGAARATPLLADDRRPQPL
jgi:hypothetical protein